MTRDKERLLGDLLHSSRQKGISGLPLLSVTLHNGLVIRDLLERRTETNIGAEDHLLVKEGFIAYNMMRVWQGALGRANVDGLVSPAYIVLKPTGEIDSKFAEYLFKTPRMIYLFWAYSYGLTKDRLRLYYKDFARIPVDIPSVSVQSKIAKILSTWDKAISTTKALINNSKQQQKALMQQLLTGKKRLPSFSQNWNKVAFGDVAKVKSKKYNPSKVSQCMPCVELEHIKQGSGRIIGNANASELASIKNHFKAGNVLFGKLRPYLRKFARPEFDGVCSTEIWVFNTTSQLLDEYLFHFVQTDSFVSEANKSAGSKMPRADWGVVSELVIKIPSLKEQKKIAAVLTNTDKEIELLEQQLTDLKQEKKALMQQLLTGKRQVKVDKSEAALA